jgi:hypothetical protein
VKTLGIPNKEIILKAAWKKEQNIYNSKTIRKQQISQQNLVKQGGH